MQKKQLIFPFRFLLAGAMLFVVFSFQRDEVISGDLAFLIGEYEYICSYDNGVKKEAAETPDKYSLRITSKSELFVYKNGKKIDKFEFTGEQLPVLDEYEYVMFNKKVKGTFQNYPLFYKGDTVVMHVLPFEFNDNYFRKR